MVALPLYATRRRNGNNLRSFPITIGIVSLNENSVVVISLSGVRRRWERLKTKLVNEEIERFTRLICPFLVDD